jgi:hypothetical protein
MADGQKATHGGGDLRLSLGEPTLTFGPLPESVIMTIKPDGEVWLSPSLKLEQLRGLGPPYLHAAVVEDFRHPSGASS